MEITRREKRDERVKMGTERKEVAKEGKDAQHYYYYYETCTPLIFSFGMGFSFYQFNCIESR